MLSLTRRTDYALVALADLARRAPERSSARQIAERFQIPPAMLMNILKDLMNSGMVDSVRGVRGGYALAQDARHISLAGLIETLEGPVRLTACCLDVPDKDAECDLMASCPTREPLQKVHELFCGFLKQVTLADIVSNRVPVTIGWSSDSTAGAVPKENTPAV